MLCLSECSLSSKYLYESTGVYLLKDGKFLPDTECQELPDDFPIPCTCLKCARANICPCQCKLIPYCTFCKCLKNNACKNNFN